MTAELPPVVIAGLNDASLSIVRSLGRKGIRIIGLYDDNAKPYYTSSKYISVKIKSPLTGDSLIQSLVHLATGLSKKAVLFCTSDSSVLTVSKYDRHLRPYFDFVLPSYDIANSQVSKKGFYEFALSSSFRVPETVFLKTSEEVRSAAAQLSFPCVVKPEFRDNAWNEKVPFKVLYAESKENLLSYFDNYGINGTPLIVQEWIDGDDSDVFFSLAYISRSGKTLAVCSGRKLLQHPRLTGSTSIAETVQDQELEKESLRMLHTAGLTGFCSVEFKRSRKNNRLYAMEPTVGRPDTQEGLALSAGLDIPYIAYRDAVGEDAVPMNSSLPETKWINEPLVFYGLQECLRSRNSLRSFLANFKGRRTYSLWLRKDPGPYFTLVREKTAKGLRRLLKRKS